MYKDNITTEKILENGILYDVLTFPSGAKEYHFNGLRHRIGDLPAVFSPDGYEEYFINGKQFRADGYVLRDVYGTKLYKKNNASRFETKDGNNLYFVGGKKVTAIEYNNQK